VTIQRVRAVVVDFNGGELTHRCVASLLATRWDGALEVVVVDNGSDPPFAARSPGVEVRRSSWNRGFAGGSNLGIGDLHDVDAVAFVNNDVVAPPEWLSPLVDALDADPSLGAASPKMRLIGSNVINNAGGALRDDWYGYDIGLGEDDAGQYDAPRDVAFWSGGAALVRAEYLRECDGFDERLFLYYEDVDLGLRGRKAGWRFRYVPASVVEHEHSATAVTGSDLTEFYKERNRLLVIARHAPWWLVVWLPIRFLTATASYALHGERAVARRRLRSFAAFLRLAPAMLRTRHTLRTRDA
jgi:GT2 family glycosyltransferase